MAKDWNGNGNSIFKTLGASNHTEKERETDDFYATDPVAIDLLLDYPNIKMPEWVWEPSCGSGCLSERLRERGHEVVSTDLVYRGYGDGGINFFEQSAMPDRTEAIVTQTTPNREQCRITFEHCRGAKEFARQGNPPYKFATEYVIHALRLLPQGGLLCLFLKTTFAEGKERYQRIFGVTPPAFVLQCSERVLCAKNADFDRQRREGTAVSYAWWIWRKGWQGQTTLDWINHPSPVTVKQPSLW